MIYIGFVMSTNAFKEFNFDLEKETSTNCILPTFFKLSNKKCCHVVAYTSIFNENDHLILKILSHPIRDASILNKYHGIRKTNPILKRIIILPHMLNVLIIFSD